MGTFFRNLFDVATSIGVIDIIDILVVAFIIYYAIVLARETRAMQLVKSIGFVFLIYFIATTFHMSTMEFLLGKILNVGLIVLVVLFQPELRRALERIGRSRITDWGKTGASSDVTIETEKLVDILCGACDRIIKNGDGALIVIERNIKLGDIIDTGTIIDGTPSEELIGNLFFKNSPLHDGAVIVRDNRIYAAGCYLPLTENDQLDKEMGTRHRAAMGVSEVSDAITIVVSEERGTTSLTEEAKILRSLSVKRMKQELITRLVPKQEKPKSFWKFGDKKNGTK